MGSRRIGRKRLKSLSSRGVTDSITAGVVQITGSTITTTTDVAINTLQKVNFAKGVDGHPLAMNYYLQQ